MSELKTMTGKRDFWSFFALFLGACAVVLPPLIPPSVYSNAAEMFFGQSAAQNEILLSALLIASIIYLLVSILGSYFFLGQFGLLSLIRWNHTSVHEILYWCGMLLLISLTFSLIAIVLEQQTLQAWLVYAFTEKNNLPFLWIVVGIVVPISEEIFFRGYLFSAAINTNFSKIATVLATSVVWAGVHYNQEWLLVGQIFILGLMLGWARLVTGGILVPVVLHVVINVAAMAYTASFLMF